jgi:hypothetical protein
MISSFVVQRYRTHRTTFRSLAPGLYTLVLRTGAWCTTSCSGGAFGTSIALNGFGSRTPIAIDTPVVGRIARVGQELLYEFVGQVDNSVIVTLNTQYYFDLELWNSTDHPIAGLGEFDSTSIALPLLPYTGNYTVRIRHSASYLDRTDAFMFSVSSGGSQLTIQLAIGHTSIVNIATIGARAFAALPAPNGSDIGRAVDIVAGRAQSTNL